MNEDVRVRGRCQPIDKDIEYYERKDFDERNKACRLVKGPSKLWIYDWMANTSSLMKKNLLTTMIMIRSGFDNHDSSKEISELLSRLGLSRDQ